MHIETTVKELRDGGVIFEEYDPGAQTDDGVAALRGQAAWFKDPDGNASTLRTGLIAPTAGPGA